MRLLTLVPGIAAALMIAACGDSSDEPASPTAQVREAAMEIFRATDPERVCGTLMTDRFVQEVYLDESRCIEISRKTKDAGRPSIGRVEPAGGRAVVEVSVEGGAADGVSGTVELAREGTTWKLDRLGADYLRASFNASIDQVSTGALSVPAMRECMHEQAETIPERLLRRFMYRAMRQDPKASETTIAIAERCPGPLAIYVARQVARALARSGKVSAAFERCAVRRIRFLLQATGLASQVLKDNTSDIGNAALQGLTLSVAGDCKRYL